MAIDLGLALDCAGLVEVGGLKNVYVTDIASLTAVTPVNSAGEHSYSALTKSGAAMFQLKPSSSSWNVTSSKENGVTKFETTIQMVMAQQLLLRHLLMNIQEVTQELLLHKQETQQQT